MGDTIFWQAIRLLQETWKRMRGFLFAVHLSLELVWSKGILWCTWLNKARIEVQFSLSSCLACTKKHPHRYVLVQYLQLFPYYESSFININKGKYFFYSDWLLDPEIIYQFVKIQKTRVSVEREDHDNIYSMFNFQNIIFTNFILS